MNTNCKANTLCPMILFATTSPSLSKRIEKFRFLRMFVVIDRKFYDLEFSFY